MKKISFFVFLLFFVFCKQDDTSLQKTVNKKDSLKIRSFSNFNKKTSQETTKVLDFFLKNKIDALKYVKFIYYKGEYFNKDNKKNIPGHMKYSNYFVLNDYETAIHQIENIKKNEKIPHLFTYRQIYIDRFEKKYKVDHEDYWQKYEKVFGKNGFATLSKPLFSKNLRFAYIEISIHCGELCGEGLYYFLEKKENNWVIIEKGCDWVS